MRILAHSRLRFIVPILETIRSTGLDDSRYALRTLVRWAGGCIPFISIASIFHSFKHYKHWMRNEGIRANNDWLTAFRKGLCSGKTTKSTILSGASRESERVKLWEDRLSHTVDSNVFKRPGSSVAGCCLTASGGLPGACSWYLTMSIIASILEERLVI